MYCLLLFTITFLVSPLAELIFNLGVFDNMKVALSLAVALLEQGEEGDVGERGISGEEGLQGSPGSRGQDGVGGAKGERVSL